MNTKDLLRIRLHNQLLAGTMLKEPQDIVSYMGAMQAQVFEMAKWGIGVRLQGSTNKSIEDAINTGKIIRTHILRPTWHFVAAEDIYWMSDLSAPRIKPIYAGYCKMIGGIEETLMMQSIRIVERLLADGNHLTKQEIGDFLIAEGIIPDNGFANQIMCRAEVEGVVCNGKLKGGKPTYALMQEWIPGKNTLCREEALERLARRFFTSHGPATIQDFVWWSGLTVTDAKKAIEQIKRDFICEEINGRSFRMRNDIQVPADNTDSALLLPPFDEFVVSYKNRSELIEDRHYGKVMTKNGLFSPTVMLNGEIVGSWKKTGKKGSIDAELSFFKKPAKRTESLFKKPAERFGAFYRE